MAAILEPVLLAETQLENVYSFRFQSCVITTDGKKIEEVEMAYDKLQALAYIWRDK